MKNKILLTRPHRSSERWAGILADHGFETEIAPLLTIVPTYAPRPVGAYQAVMLTSASAIEALRESRTDIADLLTLPCFCVGGATGEAARHFGFTNVSSGGADGAALAQTIITGLKGQPLRLLHIAGDLVDPKAHEILTKGGLECDMWPVYRAEEINDFPVAIREHFAAGAYFAIPVFSPRTARVLMAILEKNRLVRACHSMTAIALSQPVADVLQTLPWRRLRIAASPAEEDMLACLQAEVSMTENDKREEPSATFASMMAAVPAPKRRRRTRWAWGMLLVIVLAACIGSIALLPRPWPHSIAPEPHSHAGDTPEALAQPVRTLEMPLDTQGGTIAAKTPAVQNTAIGADDIAALNDKIHDLQMQMTQIQEQTRNMIAAAFAFWNLCDVIKTGQVFTPQLTALREAAAGDSLVETQSAKLAPYAATGMPTWARLREELAAAETTVPTAPASADTQGWWARLKSIFQNLVSVRPLHDPRFAALEKALDAADAESSIAAFDALPSETRKALASWRERLDAHLEIESVLRDLSAYFSTPAVQGTAP